MSFLSLGTPVIQRTARPSVAGTPLWYTETTGAQTRLDLGITVPSGDGRKLVLLWGSDGGEFPTAVTFDPAGEAIPLSDIVAEENGALRVAAYYLDAPAAGSKTLRIETESAVWSVAYVAVVQNTRAGLPEGDTMATAGQVSSIPVEPLDAFSVSFDLVLDDTHHTDDLTPAGGQTLLEQSEVNASFLAAVSSRTHANNGQVNMAWNADTGAAMVQVAVNLLCSAGQIAASTATLLSRWGMDEAGGTALTDSFGRSNGSFAAAASGAAPLLADGGGALSVRASTAAAASHADWQMPTYSVSIYCQPRSLPSAGQNRNICNRDSLLPPGGWSIEQYNDNGTSRLRAYIRSSAGGAGSATWIGASTGQGTLSVNVAHRIDLTYDGTTARLYLDRVEVASSASPNLHGLQDNAAPMRIAYYADGQGHFDGVVDRCELLSGALSAVEVTAAAGPTTITDPGAPSIITALDDPLGSVAPGGTQDVDVTANDLGIGAGNLDIEITQQPSAGSGSVINDNSPNALVRLTKANPTSTTNYTARYRVSEAGGPFSNEANITWTIAGSGGTSSFPFVTVSNPAVSHQGVASRPGYSPSDPRSASIIDPMSGIEVFRIGGNAGSSVMRNGVTDSGLKFPRRLRQENNPMLQKSWNADASLLMIDRRFSQPNDPANSVTSFLIDVTGTHGASAPWRIIRASATQGLGDLPSGSGQVWFWDMLNPLRAYVIANNGIHEWWPVGGSGNPAGRTNLLFGWPSGFDNFTNLRRNGMATAYSGIHHVAAMRRSSDGRWGGRKVNLTTGTFGPFIPTPDVGSASFNADNDRAAVGSAAINGKYTHFSPNGNRLRFFDTDTGQQVSDTGDNGIVHSDYTTVDGRDYRIGATTDVIRMWDVAGASFREVANIPGTNPHHIGCRNWKDTFENHGATGGSSQGLRYAIYCRVSPRNGHPRGIMGVRLGANDHNVIRYICNHRSVRSSNSDEVHPQVSPNSEYIAFNSDWEEPGQVTDGDLHAFVAVIPSAWYSTNNNGS